MSDRDMAALRRAIPWHQWDALGGAIARSRGELRPQSQDPEAIMALRRDGFLRLGKVAADVSPMRQYFEAQPHHEGHHVFTENPWFHGYRADQVLRCPGLLDVFNAQTVLEPVHDFLECVPCLYSVNAWWSLPGADGPQVEHVQHWHRDTDDWRFVTLFLYLTDVDEESGPTQIMKTSHRSSLSPETIPVGFSERTVETLTGPAGSLMLVNTTALHRGLVPKKPRLVAWARYGLGPNTNSMDLEQGPIARHLIPTKIRDTPVSRAVNRLLIDFDRGPI